MTNLYLGMKFALSYFTLLPVRFNPSDNLSHPRVLEWMMLSFPFVGILLAILSISLFVGLESLGWVGAIVASVCYMVLYGFLHTEAIIDVVDALHAKHGGKDPYVVIKEPTVGAMGVLYGAGFMVVKIAILATLLMHHFFSAFILITFVSRYGVAVIVKTQTFRSSFITQLHEHLRWSGLVVLGNVSLMLLLFLGYYLYCGAMIFGVTLLYIIAVTTKKLLGFMNGDAVGMALELTELFLMIGVALLWL